VNILNHHESNEQQALIEWAQLQECKYSELRLLYACPNGGWRDAREAARLKKEGVKPGVPDLFLPVPGSMKSKLTPGARRRYNGLYIEMKTKGRKPDKNQRWWREQLLMQGFCVEVCYTWTDAKDLILEYLGVN
jgi:hypothetical protein